MLHRKRTRSGAGIGKSNRTELRSADSREPALSRSKGRLSPHTTKKPLLAQRLFTSQSLTGNAYFTLTKMITSV